VQGTVFWRIFHFLVLLCSRVTSLEIITVFIFNLEHDLFHILSLGMRHDGPLAENECDPGSYIMSPTLGSGKITWSSCSRHYLQMFLE